MKTYWVRICLYTNFLMIWGLFSPQMSFAQANLVMNPSFEAYSPCSIDRLFSYDPNFYWFMPWGPDEYSSKALIKW